MANHRWFANLDEPKPSVTFKTGGYSEMLWKNARLPGRHRFAARIGGTSLLFSGPNGPALFESPQYSQLATRLNGGTKIRDGEVLIIYPDGRTVVKPNKSSAP